MKLYIALAVVAVFIAQAVLISAISYKQGYAERGEAQTEIDKRVYDEIRKKIRSGAISVDDPAAVDCFLHSVAGTKPANGECSGL